MRLIDAEKAEELIDLKGAGLGITTANRRNFKDFLKMSPTIDAEPVRHGHWIFGESWMLGRNRRCSVCDSMLPCNDAWVMFYCPDCGAKMDEN